MKKKPLNQIYIEISNVCNLKCSFCPTVDRQKAQMSLDDFRKVAEQAFKFTDQVALHQMGDPLMHPHLNECLQICDEVGLKVNLTTNGTRIESIDQNILFMPAIRQVNFSFQSFLDNKAGSPIDSYLVPIFEFSAKAFDIRPDLYINYRLWNDGAVSDNDIYYDKVESYFNVTLNRNTDVGFKKSKRIKNRLYFHFDSRFEWPSMNLPKRSETGSCHALSSHIAIHVDGKVVPCCLDKEADIQLGNVLHNPLEDILKSKRAISIRNGFDNNQCVEDLCQRCQFIDRFKTNKNRANKTLSSMKNITTV